MADYSDAYGWHSPPQVAEGEYYRWTKAKDPISEARWNEKAEGKAEVLARELKALEGVVAKMAETLYEPQKIIVGDQPGYNPGGSVTTTTTANTIPLHTKDQEIKGLKAQVEHLRGVIEDQKKQLKAKEEKIQRIEVALDSAQATMTDQTEQLVLALQEAKDWEESSDENLERAETAEARVEELEQKLQFIRDECDY